MPIHDIQVKQYQCSWCGYKWINRVNGKDGPIPERCAKCKRRNWNGGQIEEIGPKENGLRRRIKILKGCMSGTVLIGTYDINWHADPSEKFLNINPRPTMQELKQVIRCSSLRRFNNGSDTLRQRFCSKSLQTRESEIRPRRV